MCVTETRSWFSAPTNFPYDSSMRLPLAVCLLLFAGCAEERADGEGRQGGQAGAGRGEGGASAAAQAEVHMEVHVLGFASCPDSPAFLERVQVAAGQIAGVRVVYIDQESLPESDLRRGYPTPTALVDNDDLFGLPRPTSPAMACRMYPGGLPTAEQIAQRLRENAQR
jgi:hypothetical protein